MQSSVFRILVIDDDREMNFLLRRRIESHRMRVAETLVKPVVDIVDVELERADPGFWRIHDRTLQRLYALSRRNYDLVLVDFGFVDDEAKDIVWGRTRRRRATWDAARGRILTIRDLADQYAERIAKHRRTPHARNPFLTSRRVVMRSFASKLAFDLIGQVVPDRLEETERAFPNAGVAAMDPRHELYAGNEFYDFYEGSRGRDFYRQLIGALTVRVVETEVLRALLEKVNRSNVERGDTRKTELADRIDVFLSYSTADKRRAEAIFHRLEQTGIKAFLDARAIKGGDSFSEVIRAALNSSREVWVLLTPRSLKSEWVLTEWGAAWGLGKRIVPMLHRCSPNDLPDRLRSLHSVDVSKLDILIDELRNRREPPSV